MLKTHVNRCSWPTNDEQYLTYHDQEWGRVVHDDRRLFEQLVLEGAQAGLSWLTILKRRHHYKRVFVNMMWLGWQHSQNMTLLKRCKIKALSATA